MAHAVLADGRREVLAVALGSRETTRAWSDLLEDLRALAMVHALLQEAQAGWQSLSMSGEALRILEAMRIRGKAQAA